jgi:hypothetical protein
MKIDNELIEKCDLDIRNGHPLRAAERLAKINVAKVEKRWRLPLAKICRRAGLHSLGLALLRDRENASPSELAEYAVLLLRHGAVSEAERILQTLDGARAPEALLYRSYALFLNWQFEQAIPLLELYLQSPLEPYTRLVGQTNLAFALTESRRHQSALELTEEIRSSARQFGNRGLEGTCQALRAQMRIQERDLSRARKEIEAGHALHPLAQTNDHFLLMKWGLILEGLESKSPGPFNLLRQLALQAHDWEACREADLFSLLVDYSEELFVHLYFGSPLAGLRERMKAELGSIPQRTTYVLGDKNSPRLDLRTGQLDGETVLNTGKKEHQLLQVLLKDFYRPLRIGGLFSQLFPGEHFNIESSAFRVHQIIRRTRGLLKKLGVPVQINEVDEYYSLKLTGPFSFRIPLDVVRADSMEAQFECARTSCGENRPFSIQELRQRLKISEASAHRLLKWGIKNGHIEQSGKSKRALLFSVKPKAA